MAPAPTQRDGGPGVAIRTALWFVVVIWAVFFINRFFFAGTLNYFGVRPWDPQGLWGLLCAPFLHADLAHLMANTVPAAIFTGLIAWSSRRLWFRVTIIVMIISGLGAWLTGSFGQVHIGASGLIYGWLAFLLVRGFYNRSVRQILLGIVLLFSYSGMLWGVFPTQMGVSWQMHLFGAIGGIVAAARISGRNRA
ncbi:rhomboid family intramembrane serine protease [Corynebacterium sp. TAE3-ERU12]|nr:rhomboid family intramembrane serine protease [Corynebacterium sp. TAE3-ERU12]